ncbi:hypothetical protein ACIHCQ_39980 [Streptomyces sp. NPDC052236]|uniref:hypothetical protein n=1 Tax=Streptomyces sp. NPDC052236 TaxID=3365686 RepID=UPI0037D79F8A
MISGAVMARISGSVVAATAVAGLFTARRLFQDLLAVTSRRPGSYVSLADLLPTPAANSEPLPQLRPVQEPGEAFPAIPEPGVTVAELLTADGAWTAGQVAAWRPMRAATCCGRLSTASCAWDPATGTTAWTTAPALCHGPALTGADTTTMLAEGAALRFRGDDVEIVGGGLTGSSGLMPGPAGEAWVFSGTGPRTTGGYGGHTLTRLGQALHESKAHEVDFAGEVHQAALTSTGTLYLAGGGYSVTTDLDQGLRCPRDRWADPAPLTPTASLAIGDHTVLLAGPTGRPGHGVEKPCTPSTETGLTRSPPVGGGRQESRPSGRGGCQILPGVDDVPSDRNKAPTEAVLSAGGAVTGA